MHGFSSLCGGGSGGTGKVGIVVRTRHAKLTISSSNLDPSLDPGVWDSIWSHAIRRVNVPSVSRAACHAAHVLLSLTTQWDGPTRLPLTSQRILSEIETLAKDIDVQGPLYPYDSVCKFLAHCLKVASQDVRLYRMHLEEKVLSWLVDNWKMASIGRGRMPLHQMTDIILLLENVCGFNRKSDFISQFLLPDTLIVHTLVEEERTRPLRDFLLHAKVPRFGEPMVNSYGQAPAGLPDGELVQPQACERKISAFFYRSLESLNLEWKATKEDYARLTAEMARRSLDFAVAALSFEALLICNGTNCDRRVTQSAAKLVTSVTRALKEAPWTTTEKALVTLGLDPLVYIEREDETVPWQVMLPPNSGTGIKKHVLHRLTSRGIMERERRKAMRMDFLRVLWQIGDVGAAQLITLDIVNTFLRSKSSSLGRRCQYCEMFYVISLLKRRLMIQAPLRRELQTTRMILGRFVHLLCNDQQSRSSIAMTNFTCAIHCTYA